MQPNKILEIAVLRLSALLAEAQILQTSFSDYTNEFFRASTLRNESQT